jgi:hypothetical protein
MKGKGKQDIFALMTFKLSSKNGFGQRKGMANVQVSIAVGIRKGHHEGFFRRVWIRLECTKFFPLFLDSNFILSQAISLGRALSASAADGHLFHARGGCFFCHGWLFVCWLVCWLVGLLVGWLTIFFVNTLFIPLG